jgi:hypothetical protein
MTILRRPPSNDLARVADVWSEITLVANATEYAEAGATGPATDVRCQLRTTDDGLVIGSSSPSESSVPSLVPWAVVEQVTAEEHASLPDGSPGRVLEIRVTRSEFLGGDQLRKYVAPGPELTPFLLAVDAGRSAEVRSDPTVTDAAGVTGALVAGQSAGAATTEPKTRTRRPLLRPASQHSLGRRRIGPIVIGLLALVLLTGSANASFRSAAGGASNVNGASGPFIEQGNGAQAELAHPSADLPAATAPPAPAPPSLAGSPPLQSHEIFGYAPYWTLPQSPGFDVQDLTTLAYFSIGVNGDGTLQESGAGWNGYESQDLANLVTRSHAAGDRVVLTVTDFSQASLNAITSSPTAAATLSAALIAAVSAKNLDGVNFDFEGQGSADRNGLTTLITQVSNALHAANPHWQVTMATYASAAADPSGFYDVAALAPALDGFFVMAYDMNSQTTPSATAPLVGGGYNDTEALQQFTAVVPPSKIILGVPYYGYDWPTTTGASGAAATGAESPLSDSVIAASGHPTYWDPTTQTAWTSYQVGTQWHETYFDDPTSLALKAQLADSFQIAGLGIWALGMDGNNPAMLAALLGNAPAVKDLQTGPTSTVPTVPPGTGYTSTGVWNGATEALSPIAFPSSPGTIQYVGTLTGLQTTAPTLTCLEGGAPISVWQLSGLPGVYVAVATQPQDCALAIWTFTPTAAPTGSTTTTTTTAPATTTTTAPSSTTTTTSTPSSTTTTTSTPSSTTTTTTLAGGGHLVGPSFGPSG